MYKVLLLILNIVKSSVERLNEKSDSLKSRQVESSSNESSLGRGEKDMVYHMTF